MNSSKDIQRQLRQFLSISSAAGSSSNRNRQWNTYSVQDLIEPATALLIHVPATRQAVLAYVGFLVHDGVHLYFLQMESSAPAAGSSTGFDTSTIEETVGHFCHTLSVKMKENPCAWRKTILKWSVDLLANVSQVNAGRRATTNNGIPKSLNELLKLYTSCKSTQCVAQLLKSCLKDLLESDTEQCISTLVESAKFGTHFDWVLSYVGTCFPQTIFSRLLSAGLEEFDSHVNDMLSKKQSISVSQANQIHEKYGQKIRSLSAIFGHLARQRSTELTKEIRPLISIGLSRRASRLEQRGIPFLFKLATFSKELLLLIIKEMEDLLTVENLLAAAKIFAEIPSRFLVPEDKTSVDKLLVGMLSVLSQTDVVPLFERLLCLAFEDVGSDQIRNRNLLFSVRNQSLQILEYFLTNLEIQVHGELAFGDSDIPILDRVYSELEQFVNRLYSPNDQEKQYVFRILVVLALARGENVANEIMHLILLSAENPKQLESFVAVCTLLRPFYPRLCEVFFEKFPATCKMMDSRNKNGPWLKNVRTLMVWEANAAENSEAKLMKFREAAQNCFAETSLFLLTHCLTCSLKTGLECLGVLEAIGPCVHQLPKNSVLICQKLVRIVIMSLKNSEIAEGLELYWKSTEFSLFFLPTQATFCQEIFIRVLMDIIFEEEEALFENDPVSKKTEKIETEISLLEENRKEAFWNRQASTMVHSGVIGQGLRHQKPWKIQEGPLFRRLLLVHLVDRFCQNGYKPRNDGVADGSSEIEYSPASCKMLAILLTEKLCTDCIASEHIWEDWSYAKLNLERFLAVNRNVEKFSFAWDLLLLCAEAYPCLWYCAPVVKCVLGAVMAQCEGSVEKNSVKVPEKFLKILDKWFLLTRTGDILPENLSYFYEVLSVVSQYEAFVVLLDIWRYFQHIMPDMNKLNQHFEYLQLKLEAEGGNRIVGIPEDFTEASRYVVQANIEHLGCLFRKLFPASFSAE